MKSRSRQAEVVARTNRIKAQLNRLKRHKDFTPNYAAWTLGGNPCGFLSYTHLGIEARLRFSQDTYEWKATCPHFGTEISFPDQDAENIIDILNDWLLAHIDRPISPDARLRSNRPSVQGLATRHKINPTLALEMYEERGF